MEVFVGSMMLVGFNFAPTGFALCEGQLLPISQNTALFSLIGTYYGGDGRSNFALPDLRGRLVVSQGQRPGAAEYTIGQAAGTTAEQLTTQTVPAHTHNVLAAKGGGSSPSPNGNSLAEAALYAPANAQQLTPMNGGALGPSIGGTQPHNNMMPYLGLNWIIALTGVFPPRS